MSDTQYTVYTVYTESIHIVYTMCITHSYIDRTYLEYVCVFFIRSNVRTTSIYPHLYMHLINV